MDAWSQIYKAVDGLTCVKVGGGKAMNLLTIGLYLSSRSIS